MAKYGEGTNYAKQDDPVAASNIIDPGLLGGKLRVFQDTATVSASSNLNSTDYILVGGKLPTGSQVVKVILGHGAHALGTQAAVDVGDEGDQNRYLSNIQISTANVQVGPNVVGGQYYTVTGTTDNYIRITGTAAGTRVTSGTIKISVFYVVE